MKRAPAFPCIESGFRADWKCSHLTMANNYAIHGIFFFSYVLFGSVLDEFARNKGYVGIISLAYTVHCTEGKLGSVETRVKAAPALMILPIVLFCNHS